MDPTDSTDIQSPMALGDLHARHVVFLNRFYAPDIAATAQMLSDLCEDLAANGWRVSVISSQTGYDAASGHPPPPRELRQGVDITRVRGTRFGRTWSAGRLSDHLSYALRCLLSLTRIPKPDVIVAMSDPPFILGIAVIAARLHGAKVVYWAQDLYPSLASKLGILDEKGLAFRILDSIARRLQARSDLIVGLGPHMVRTLVSQGAPANRTICIHNWADERSIRPIPPAENWFVAAHKLEGKFVVLYSGNAGRGHTFEALCESMRRCKGNGLIVFVFIGGGKKSDEIRAYATAEGLPNTMFLDYVQRRDLAYSLSAASVSIVTEDPSVVGLLVPSKIYGILASGRPVIFVGSAESDLAEIVTSTGCGVTLGPDDAEGLIAAIHRLQSSPAECARMGNAARQAAEHVYSRHQAMRKWQLAFASLVSDKAGRRM
jgi:colanic acid biosynthesis glycosyl transferase WcaI